MTIKIVLTDAEQKEMDTELVYDTDNADDLVQLVVEKKLHPSARQAAAQKIIEMWNRGWRRSVTLDHLAHVGDHAAEPFKSQANQIISDSI